MSNTKATKFSVTGSGPYVIAMDGVAVATDVNGTPAQLAFARYEVAAIMAKALNDAWAN